MNKRLFDQPSAFKKKHFFFSLFFFSSLSYYFHYIPCILALKKRNMIVHSVWKSWTLQIEISDLVRVATRLNLVHFSLHGDLHHSLDLSFLLASYS